jgi:hypothetical protein
LRRPVGLAVSVLVGGFVVIAYCGNYDKGEATIQRLADALKCDYEALEFIDTHPNIFDFAKYARTQTIQSRGVLSRLTASTLYPTVLVGVLCWFIFVVVDASVRWDMTWVVVILYGVCVPILFVAARCAWRFASRRIRHSISAEKARRGIYV